MDYLDEKMINIYKNSDEFFKAKKNDRVVLMTTKASKIYTEFKFKTSDTLLFGRESAGVPDEVHKRLENRIKIPMIEKKKILEPGIFSCNSVVRKYKAIKYLWIKQLKKN